MNKAIFIYSVLFILLLLSGCYYDSEEVVYYPALPGECDTTNVTYNATIAPIMADYCTNCHGADAKSSGGGIDLRTYNAVSANVDKIYSSMNHTSPKPMPKGGSKLNNCIINEVKAWKDNGMPQ
jgi:mono/diheme cytochrome c family protein